MVAPALARWTRETAGDTPSTAGMNCFTRVVETAVGIVTLTNPSLNLHKRTNLNPIPITQGAMPVTAALGGTAYGTSIHEDRCIENAIASTRSHKSRPALLLGHIDRITEW
jgi:hypothetical protein